MRTQDLLSRLEELGATVVVHPDRTTGLRTSSDPHLRAQAVKLIPLLKEHRAAVLKHFEAMEAGHDGGTLSGDAHPGKRCPECHAYVFTDDPVEVARCCNLVACPLRIPDAAERQRRNRELWAKRRAANGGG